MARQAHTRKKHHVETSCFDLAIERLHHVFERYDQIDVSFSGGKDSTVCLNLALQVATELKRLPLRVISFDEEAIPPETVEYMARVAARPDVVFSWYCVPIQHRNACSTDSPYWWPWAPEARELWVRPLPETAITDYPGFTRAGIAEQVPALFPLSGGAHASIMGIRTQESLSRYHAVASRSGFSAYLTQLPDGHAKAYPIYDWATDDVWRAPQVFGWDYNRAYDVMDAAGLTRHDQRCAPPYGEQPIRRLHTYQTCWPELWAKMCDRVPGAATAARYANTELYGIGVAEDDLPAGVTWREWTMQTLRQLPPVSRQEAAFAIEVCLSKHRNTAGTDPVPDLDPHPLSGFSWKVLYIAAKIGGNKFGRTQQKMLNRAIQFKKKTGVPMR
jgi:predicted phosphoadenosine phosphosulfate sulfurtransferase